MGNICTKKHCRSEVALWLTEMRKVALARGSFDEALLYYGFAEHFYGQHLLLLQASGIELGQKERRAISKALGLARLFVLRQIRKGEGL